MNFRTKLTKQVRDELMAIYAEHGMKGVEPHAKRAGVTAKHIANISSDAGMRRQPNQRRHRDDPRWGWAKERGAVIA
jgi:hypothetical protein